MAHLVNYIERLLELRDQALAHSDFDKKPTRWARSDAKGFLIVSRPFDVLSEGIDLRVFRSMCKKMDKHCVGVLFNLNRKRQATNREIR